LSGAEERPTDVDASGGRGVQVGDQNTQYNYFFVEPARPGIVGAATANNDIFDHVPDSHAEIEYIMGHRPPAWEYLMYAGLLQVGLRDAKRGYKARRPSQLVFANSREALKRTSTLMDELRSIIRETVDCFEPVLLSKALGEPGRPGEFRLIYDIASRLIIAYGKFIDWGKSTRTVQVPRPAQRLYSIFGRFADRPMSDIEEYVSRLVASLDDAVRRASNGEHHPVVLKLVCEINADEELAEEFVTETERAYLWMKEHPGK
jgi:hypothetical protein